MSKNNPWKGFCMFFMVINLVGCGKTTPVVRMEEIPAESVKTVDPSSADQVSAPQVLHQVDERTKIVTGEPVGASEGSATDEPAVADDTGALAVKVEY